MVDITLVSAALIFGYLLGSIPFGLVLTSMAGLADIRKSGSGNIGATNVLRTGRKDLAIATLLLDGGKGATGERLRDSVASIALDARNAWALIHFKRNVALHQFLDGISDNLRQATRAGVITPQDYLSISSSLPRWYAFLEQRGIHTGDRMYYRIRDDSLHTVYLASDGETLLDQVDVGPERRLSVLGGYFAPGSDFRDKLVDSLLSGP